jgi:hypothetical protein
MTRGQRRSYLFAVVDHALSDKEVAPPEVGPDLPFRSGLTMDQFYQSSPMQLA